MNLKNGLTLIIVLTLLGVMAGYKARRYDPQIVERVVHDTRQIEVPVHSVTEKVVERVVADPTQRSLINKLLKENHDLRSTVTNLTSTIAVNPFESGPVQADPVQRDLGDPRPYEYEFKDFQLEAKWAGPSFFYSLNQKFHIITTNGRDNKGHTTGLVRLFQYTPEGPKEVPIESSVVVQAVPNPIHWQFGPRIQAGVGSSKDGVVALQWLTHGSSHDPKDIRWALLSPAYSTQKELGLLPFSFNLGNLPRQPFTNIWVSPYISAGKRVGLTITATF